MRRNQRRKVLKKELIRKRQRMREQWSVHYSGRIEAGKTHAYVVTYNLVTSSVTSGTDCPSNDFKIGLQYQ